MWQVKKIKSVLPVSSFLTLISNISGLKNGGQDEIDIIF